MQIRCRENLWQAKLEVSPLGPQGNGFWQQMDRLDSVVYFNSLFFGDYQW